MCKLWGSSSSPSSLSFGSSAADVAAPNERAKEDFTIYDDGDERASEDERDLKVSHSATKVKDGFPPMWTDLSLPNIQYVSLLNVMRVGI